MVESRIKKSLLNARVNLIFYFLTLVLSFFSRKIFLNSLGDDFLGFTGTLQNLLGFLNLAELGVSVAIGYVLYKPIYDGDNQVIMEIISVLGYLYRYIAIIILFSGCVLSCFLPFIFPLTGISFGVIYFAYFSFLFSALIGYFFNYRQTLLAADQRNYVITTYFQTTLIIKTLIQILFAYYTRNYYIWVSIELIFGIVYSYILNWKLNRVYPWLKSEIKQGKKILKKYPDIIKYIKQLFFHRITGFIQYQTTPLFIYAFVSLQTVTFYGNYTLVTDKLSALVNNFLGSTGAGVGNLIAENNSSKILKVFWELISIRFFIGGILVFALYFLINPFMFLWLGNEYILSNTVIVLILCNVFIGQIRDSTDQFLYGYGLFNDIGAPIIETVLYVLISLIGGSLWGLPGILLGTVISRLIVIICWKPIFLYRKGFKLPVKLYWLNWFKYLGVIVLSFFLNSKINQLITINPYSSYLSWILYAIVSVSIYVLSSFILLFIFTQGMKDITYRILKYKR